MNTTQPLRRFYGPKLLTLVAGFLLQAISANSTPGDLYVADQLAKQIVKYSPKGAKTTFATDVNATGLVFDRSGNLFAYDVLTGAILKFAPDGTRSVFVTIGGGALSMAGDGKGNFFVSGGIIIKVASDGTITTVYNGVDAWPLAFDRLGNLYFAINPIGPSTIEKLASDGTITPFVKFTGPGESVTGLAFDQSGNLFARRGGTIDKISPDGTVATFATGDFQYPLAFDTSGNLFASPLSFDDDTPCLLKFSPDGTSTTFASGSLSAAAFAFEPVSEKLRNISARGLVGTGDDALIGGFIMGGSALADNAVVVRAIGPSLGKTGVTNPLSDPTLELRDSSGALIATNDNWQDTQAVQISATGLAPVNTKEAAIYAALPQGSYTAVVRGANDVTGTALVEVYSISQ